MSPSSVGWTERHSMDVFRRVPHVSLPSVTLVSVSSPAVLAAGCGSTTSSDWVPLPWEGLGLRMRCEVAQELIFGIPVSVPTVLSEAHPGDQASSAAGGLSPHRSVSGYSVTVPTTEVFVADLILGQPRAQLNWLCSCPRVLWPKSCPRSTQCRPSIFCSSVSQMEFVLMSLTRQSVTHHP